MATLRSGKKGFLEDYSTDTSSDSDADDNDNFPDPSNNDEISEFRTSHHRRKRRRTGREARDNAALGVFGSDSEYEDNGRRGGGRSRGSGRPLRMGGMGFVKGGGAGGAAGDVSMGDDDAEEDDEEEEEDEKGRMQENLNTFAGLRKGKEEEDGEEEDEARVGLGGMGSMRSFAHSGLGAAYPEDEESEYSTPQPDEEESRPRLGLRKGKESLFKGFMKAGLGGPGSASGPSTGGANSPHQVASGAATPGVDHRGLGFKASTPDGPPLANETFESPLGTGFVSSIAHEKLHRPVSFASPKAMNEPLISRPSFTDAAQRSRRRGGGVDGPVPAVNPNSFAAKMMAKMGYVPGQGLGSQGQGILQPIEVKLRPQGAGVGVIREQTEQAKAEQRRAAALRGEVLSDSESEKERKGRKAKKKAAKEAGGAAAPGKKKVEKPKFKTADEIEKSAVGLHVPSVLKNIVDMTGPETRILSSASGLFVPAAQEEKKRTPEEEEKLKIARTARRDLEAFAAEWNGLQDRKTYANVEEQRLAKDVDEQTEQVQRLTALLGLIRKMKRVSIVDSDSVQSNEEAMKEMVEKLETLQFQFKDETEVYKLSEMAVAAIAPVFKQCMASWDPLSDPFYLTELLRRLRPLLKVKTKEDIEARLNKRGYIDRPSKTATFYESLINNLWLPKVRSAINNQWDVHDPSHVLSLLEAWGFLLPPFIIHAIILDQIVVPKLRAAIEEWNPRLESPSAATHKANKKRTKTPAPPPHIWIFPWLPHLSTETHLPTLLTAIKSKFTTLLTSHPLPSGPLPSLPEWTSLLGGPTAIESLLIRHLLPRLALHLRTNLTINPADQDLSPLEIVWRWRDGFRVSTLAQLISAEVFPKWLSTLHTWLVSEGVRLGEVGEWFQWWQGVSGAGAGVADGGVQVLPEEVAKSPLVMKEFEKGLDLINKAMELGPGTEKCRRELPLPEAGPARPIRPSEEPSKKEKRERERERERERQKAKTEIVSFRDAIEDWCAENNLLLIPLRKADEKSGHPLLRITPSASGTGGVVVYLRGDVVWVQKGRGKGRKAGEGPDGVDGGGFEPVGLGEVLERVGL